MAVVEVACPGCQATLKAPDGMAGKKARCKKCGMKFHIPGRPATDSGGEPQMLSAIDAPLAPAPSAPEASPFNFLAAFDEPQPRKKARDAEEDAERPAKSKRPKPASKAAVPAAVPLNEILAATPAEAAPDEAFSLDDADALPVAPAAPAEPFGFNPAEPAPSMAKSRRRRDEDEDEKDEKVRKPVRGYHQEPGGSGKVILFAVVFGVIVLGGGIAAVVVVMNMKKDGDQAKVEKKDKTDPPADSPPPKDDTKEPPPKDDSGKKPPGKAPGLGKTPGKTPAGTGGTPGNAAMLVLPPTTKAVQFQPLREKPEKAQDTNKVRMTVEAAFPTVRRIFPPSKSDTDVAVLWQREAGFQGKGEKLRLELYSSDSGKRIDKDGIEADGDGRPDPLCDLSATADLFAIGADGKVTVWNTRDKMKLLDKFDPYADKPDHQKAGLAAVYLTEPPDRVVTVTTAGAVHVWVIATKTLAGEFVPPKSAASRVVAGKSVALGPGRKSLVMATSGGLYQVSVKPDVGGGLLADLGGNAGRSLGLAVSGSGKVVYAFETNADGKQEKAVMAVTQEGAPLLYRWPEKVGEPVGAGWADGEIATIPTARGEIVWFDAAEKGFRPLALVQLPGDKAMHATAENQWTLLPNAGDPKKSVLFELKMPPEGLVDLDIGLTTKRPALTLKLDEKALSK